ncbi:DUF2961 domain-containing protein [Bacteroides sp.]|uniref:DUF2961 domain-containing protein n=1 Tax=Bacteroides sp. TaxID=29523 RepID=UPI002623F5F4|nr:DUF2961 domain-containing protein [Bacteroides sp.]MDD3039355.1 DUF2961 domain-containing protein [Bacteroides sp.]
MKRSLLLLMFFLSLSINTQKEYPFNGLDMNMGTLSKLSNARTRSISPENRTGEKGKGGMGDLAMEGDARNVAKRRYQEFTTSYAGMYQVIRPDGLYSAVQTFGLYSWHIVDPIRFDRELKVTIQDLGWRHDGRYNNQKSDIASTVFWYQAESHAKFLALLGKDDLEIPTSR